MNSKIKKDQKKSAITLLSLMVIVALIFELIHVLLPEPHNQKLTPKTAYGTVYQLNPVSETGLFKRTSKSQADKYLYHSIFICANLSIKLNQNNVNNLLDISNQVHKKVKLPQKRNWLYVMQANKCYQFKSNLKQRYINKVNKQNKYVDVKFANQPWINVKNFNDMKGFNVTTKCGPTYFIKQDDYHITKFKMANLTYLAKQGKLFVVTRKQNNDLNV